MSAFARVLQTPELLRAIYRFSDRPEQFKLPRVSPPFFKVGVAIIWEKIEGIHVLLVLLPGVQCTRREGECKAKTITIPELPMDLVRFNRYAPFVKSLEVYDKDTKKYWIPNWRGFGTSARNETLLPNLKTLTLTTTSGCSTSQLMWIRAFLSPSLISIEATFSQKHVPLISYRSASALLRYIAETCPNIQNLSIFPDSQLRPIVENDQEMHDEQAMLDFWDSSLAPHLKRLGSVSELAVTTEMLAPDCLIHLANMQSLSRLTIYPTATPFQVVESPSIVSAAGFKALRHFKLFAATSALIENIWRLRIFNNLTSLELNSVTLPLCGDDAKRCAPIIAMLSLIAKNSPSLSNLVIDFYPYISGTRLYSLGSLSSLDSLVTLPLKGLCLRGGYPVFFPSIPCPRAVDYYLQHIVELELPSKRCTLEVLSQLSRLPSLVRLVSHLELKSPGAVGPRIKPSHSNLRVLESSSSVDVAGDVHAIASYLLLLWPKLQSVKWVTTARRNKIEPSAGATISVALDGALSLIRQLNEMKKRAVPSRPQPQPIFSINNK